MMNSENKGYSLAVINGNNKDKKEKKILRIMPSLDIKKNSKNINIFLTGFNYLTLHTHFKNVKN